MTAGRRLGRVRLLGGPAQRCREGTRSADPTHTHGIEKAQTPPALPAPWQSMFAAYRPGELCEALGSEPAELNPAEPTPAPPLNDGDDKKSGQDSDSDSGGGDDGDEGKADDAASAQGASKSGPEPAKRRRVDPGREARTVFVGNVPTGVKKRALIAIFKPYGVVESVRFRSAAFADPSQPRLVSLARKEFHDRRAAMNAYVVFKSANDAERALAANGVQMSPPASSDGATQPTPHVLRVDRASAQHNHTLSVFVGNLPYDAQEDEVRRHFQGCGEVSGVRLIRDRKLNIGKGFGYVLFSTKAATTTALLLHGTKLRGREIRVFASKERPKRRAETAEARNAKGFARRKKDPSALPARRNAAPRAGSKRPSYAGDFASPAASRQSAKKRKHQKRRRDFYKKRQRDSRAPSRPGGGGGGGGGGGSKKRKPRSANTK